MMPFDDDDELRRRLASLGADLDQAGLPGPTAARERAAQRTRHQITSGVAAGVAVVALGGLGIVQAFDTTPHQLEPADPVPTTPSDETTAIPGEAYLVADEIEDDEGRSWENVDAPREGIQECLALGSYDAAAKGSVYFADEVAGSSVVHDVWYTPGGDSDALFDAIVDDVVACVPDWRIEGSEQEYPLWARRMVITGVGEEMWATTYFADHDTGGMYVAISVTRQDDLISIVTRSELRQDFHYDYDLATPVNAAERACVAIYGETCVDDPVIEDPDPAPDQTSADGDAADDILTVADDPFLSDADVGPVGTYTGFQRAGIDAEIAENVAAQQYSACVEPLPDAEVTRHAHYGQDLGEGVVSETVLQLSSTAEAQEYVAAHSSRPDPCADSGDPQIDVSNTAPEPLTAGEAAYGWQVDYTPTPDHPGTEPGFFGAGVAHRDNIVVIVTFGAFGDPTDGGWSAYVQERLALAFDAAVDD